MNMEQAYTLGVTGGEGKKVRRSFPARALFLLVSLLTSQPATVRAEPASQVLSYQVYAETGFSIADDAAGNFLSEFRRFGGVNALGYPASRPYHVGGFTYQAFQRAILQWRPELGRAVLANTFDWLSSEGRDNWLDSLGIPRPIADSGGRWDQVVAEREGWLTEPRIAAAYRSGRGMERFGLPQSRPEKRGPFVVQRFQRIAFQLWTDGVIGMPAPGSVVGVLAGDLAKQAGIVPASATVPDSQRETLASRGGDPGALSTIDPDAEQLALSLINQARSQAGLPPLVHDAALQGTARAYAEDMAARNYFAHTNPEGQDIGVRLRLAGVTSWTIALENLGHGWNYSTPTDAVQANHQVMMAETPPNDGHRVHILNERVRRVGIGVVQRVSDGHVYYVSHFAD